MQDFGLGAGLAALAFWGFISSVVVAGIWYAVREREAQHETVRRLVESGQSIDSELMDKHKGIIPRYGTCIECHNVHASDRNGLIHEGSHLRFIEARRSGANDS